jgi:two-component system phosphate regulon sensor histidine kinase PhoR
MPSVIRREIARLCATLLPGLVVGLVFDATLLMLGLATVAWVTWHGVEIGRLLAWSAGSLARPRGLTGIWASLGERLYLSRRSGRRRRERLLSLLRLYRTTTERLPDAAVLMNEAGEIQWFNPVARSILGLTPADVGQNVVNLLRHPRIVNLVNSGDAGDLIEIASPIDEQRTLDIRLIPADTNLRLLLVQDVTQIQRLLTMRQDFVANVSHELRTPLTVILGYLETLEDDDVDADTLRDIVHRMESPAHRMKALVDDLLLLSKLDSGQPPAVDELPPVDVPSMLQSLCAEARQLSGGAHDIQLEADTALWLSGIEPELYSAFNNLIVNAIRYSPDGGPVTVRWLPSDHGARFEVEDRGIGIPQEHLRRLTERFYRVDVGRSRIKGGTGLGLAIVKHILRRHDSRLEITSEVGKGSTFTCEFAAERIVHVHRAKGATANRP